MRIVGSIYMWAFISGLISTSVMVTIMAHPFSVERLVGVWARSYQFNFFGMKFLWLIFCNSASFSATGHFGWQALWNFFGILRSWCLNLFTFFTFTIRMSRVDILQLEITLRIVWGSWKGHFCNQLVLIVSLLSYANSKSALT